MTVCEARSKICRVLVIVIVSLLAVGFYAFIGTSSKQASEMMLAGMWLLLGLAMLGSIIYSLLR